MAQYQALRDIEQILEFLEVCIPVYIQIFNVIWSKMNSGFRRCRHEKSPDQNIGLQSFNTEYWCLLCDFQLLSQFLDDFFKESMVGDLHIVQFQLCPFDLNVITSLQLPGTGWCWKIECHLVAALENMLLGLGCCFRISFLTLGGS